MALDPFLVSPVEIEPASTGAKGYIGGESGSTGLSQTYPPFLYGGNLYIILQAAGTVGLFVPPGGIYIYKSSDQGATWAALDAANGPSRADPDPTAGFLFDGVSTVIVGFSPDGGPVVGNGTYNLQNFDLITETWGAVYGAGGEVIPRIVVNQVYQRPDTSLLLLTNRTAAGFSAFGLRGHIYSGGGWSADFDVDSNLPGGWRSNGRCACVMDSTGRVHVFGVARDGNGSGANQELFYQAIETDNSLGVFAVVQTDTPNLPGNSFGFQPCVSGDNVCVGLVDLSETYATIAYGTPLSAPVFSTLAAPGIDPTAPVSNVQRVTVPQLAADATGIYAAYKVGLTVGNAIIRTCLNTNITTPGVGWDTSILAYTDTGIGMQFVGIARDTGNLFATMNAGAPQPTQYWLGVFAVVPPVVPLTFVQINANSLGVVTLPNPASNKCG